MTSLPHHRAVPPISNPGAVVSLKVAGASLVGTMDVPAPATFFAL